jgi:hypothetical protein
MNSGGPGRRPRPAALARDARRDAEAPQPDLARAPVGHHVGRFDVLVDEAAAVQLAQRRGETGTDAQHVGDLHRRARALNEQFATGILEHERGSPLVRPQRKRMNRPRRIQLVPQRVFMLQHLDDLWSRMLRPRHHDQHRSGRRGRVRGVAGAAQDELTVLENGVEAVGGEIYGRGFHVGRLSWTRWDLRATPFNHAAA